MNRALRPYFMIEARAFAVRGPIIGFLAGALMITITHILVPKLPLSATSLLEKTFEINGSAALFLINDYLALYAVLFFAGLAELLRALTAPREERQLELLLSKPISTSTYVIARAAPVLFAIWFTSLLLGIGTALLVAPVSSPASATALGTFFGFLLLGAVVVVILAALTPLLVRSKDGFEALIIGFVAWVIPLLPSTLFLYRPDLFAGRRVLASLLVIPANLIWHDAQMPVLALAMAIVTVPLAWALLLRAGRVLQRTGV